MENRPKQPKNGKNKLGPNDLPRGEVSPWLQPLRHGGPDPPSSRVFRAPPRLRALPLRTRFQTAHGSRNVLVSLTWPRPLADECSLNDSPSSALGLHSPSLYLCLGIKRASLCQDSLREKSGGFCQFLRQRTEYACGLKS